MDIFGMTGRERMCWLRANRVTLLCVGIVWVGMIFHRVSQGEMPWFLIAMVPTFALIRLIAYFYYKHVLSS